MELEKKEKDKNKEKLDLSMRLLFLVLMLLPLLVVATYTWFSLTRTPKVTEMGLSVSSDTGLELAFLPNDEEWTQYLDFREQLEEVTQLKPVTWSEENQSFYAAAFGVDGRITGITERLSDETNTNSTSSNGYYMKKTCYARTGVDVAVSLSPAIVGADGTEGAGTYVIGTPIWNSETISHDNGGSGAEYAIRVGIRITKFDAETETRTGETIFYVYEPNSDKHVSEQTGVIDTGSIDGTETLVPASRLIQQTTSSWSEAYPVQRDVTIRELGDFTTDTHLFDLSEDEFAKIDIYVWLEGQDVDCTNMIGMEAQIFVNMQFATETGGQSGLEKIE